MGPSFCKNSVLAHSLDSLKIYKYVVYVECAGSLKTVDLTLQDETGPALLDKNTP